MKAEAMDATITAATDGKEVITLPDTSGVGAGPMSIQGIGPIISSFVTATAVTTKMAKQATKIADEYLQAISKLFRR